MEAVGQKVSLIAIFGRIGGIKVLQCSPRVPPPPPDNVCEYVCRFVSTVCVVVFLAVAVAFVADGLLYSP